MSIWYETNNTIYTINVYQLVYTWYVKLPEYTYCLRLAVI